MDSLVITNRQLAMALKARRKSLGLTQVEAASRVGLLPKTVSAMESRPERASVESLFKYLSALDMEIYLHRKEETPNAGDGEW